jgi:hypothetical protein
MGSIFSGASKIWSSQIEGRAKKKAIDKLKKAWNKLEQINVEKMSEAVLKGDKEFWRQSYAFQEEIDPAMAAVRRNATEQFSRLVDPDSQYARQQDAALQTMFDEQLQADPKTTALIDTLITRAQEELDSGATMGPALQAELVRSGLESSAQSGFGIDSRGIVGANVRTLLGSAGEQLRANRLGQAQAAAGTAENLRMARANILGSLIPASQQVESQRAALAQAGIQAGHQFMPQVGVQGREIANMMEQNRQFRNERTMALAGLSAQKRLAEGQMWSETSQGAHEMGEGITSLAMGGMGGMGGMMGGMGGMMGGGGGATTQSAGSLSINSLSPEMSSRVNQLQRTNQYYNSVR